MKKSNGVTYVKNFFSGFNNLSFRYIFQKNSLYWEQTSDYQINSKLFVDIDRYK